MITITDPGRVYADIRFDEPVVVDAPGVRFVNTRHYGNNPDDTLIKAGPGTVLDHVYVEGSDRGQRVGVLANAANVLILSPTIIGITHSQDAQAILGYDGTANLVVSGGHLESSGENIMFGGADPTSEAGIPHDIVVRGVTLTKPLTYRGQSDCTVKNIFEVKNAKRVLLQDCQLSYSWVHGQTGFGILLTVRNQDNTAPFSTLKDIRIVRNRVRACAGGVQILGKDTTNPSVAAENISIEDNYIEIDPANYGGNGRAFQVSNGTRGLLIARNTVKGLSVPNSFLAFDGEPTTGLFFADNDVYEGEYGITGTDCGLGVESLDRYAPGYQWHGNTVHRDPSVGRTIPYPDGTTVV